MTAGASVALAALVTVCLPFAGRWFESVYLLPIMLMALSVPFACIQSTLEGIGRTYGWIIPSLLPIYILRHGLLLSLGAGVGPGALGAAMQHHDQGRVRKQVFRQVGQEA